MFTSDTNVNDGGIKVMVCSRSGDVEESDNIQDMLKVWGDINTQVIKMVLV